MTPHRVFALASLAALLAASAASLAQPPDGPDGPGGPPGPPPMMRGMPGGGDAPGMVIPLMLHAANMTPDQREKMKALMAANRRQLRTLFDRLKTANDALAGKLVGPAPVDAAALRPEVERVEQARQQLMEHGLAIVIGLRAILTPDQLAAVTAKRAKLEDLQRQMREVLRD